MNLKNVVLVRTLSPGVSYTVTHGYCHTVGYCSCRLNIGKQTIFKCIEEADLVEYGFLGIRFYSSSWMNPESIQMGIMQSRLSTVTAENMRT